MIKSEMGSVSMRGTTPVLISELALAMKSLRESLVKRYGEVATEEMITAISGVRSIVEEDFGTDVANQFIDKAVEIAKQNNSEIDILELVTELAEVRENGSK